MLRPCVNAKYIRRLAKCKFKSLWNIQGIRHLGSSGACGKNGTDGQGADRLNQNK